MRSRSGFRRDSTPAEPLLLRHRHSDHTIVQYATYPEVSFHQLLPALTKVLERKADVSEPPKNLGLNVSVPNGPKDRMVSQAAFWPLVGNFLGEDDIVVAETGTSSFGMIGTPLPKGATFVSQVLWGSIGWAGGSTLGALLAAQESEKPRRVLLFTGEGSLQLTAQEVATMVRLNLKPILVVLNNDGYVRTFAFFLLRLRCRLERIGGKVIRC